MRERIINLLYDSRLLRGVLPLFYMMIGKTKVKGGRFNSNFCIERANLYHDYFCFENVDDNYINIGEKTTLEYSTIRVKGINNKVVIGAGAYLNGLEIIIEGDGNEVIIGNDTFISGNTRIYVVDGSRFHMGNGCMLSDRIEIRTTDNHSIIDQYSGTRINREKDVILHDNVWIGTGVTILKGTEIAKGSIVGAASVVTGVHTKSNIILAGNPAKEIKEHVTWLMDRIK